MRTRSRAGLFVFLIHNVSDSASEFERGFGLSTRVDTFRMQIDWICRYHDVIHPDDLSAGHLPKRAALLTFDDGFKGVFDNALPVLEDKKVPAVLFLNLGVVKGEPNAAAVATFAAEHEAEGWSRPAHISPMHVATPELIASSLQGLSPNARARLDTFAGTYAQPEDLEAWDGHPLFRYGNHLWNHYYGPALSQAELRSLYQRNEAELMRYRSSLPWFAFTNGRYDDMTMATIRAFHPRYLFTGQPRSNTSHSPLLHRFDLNEVHSSNASLTGALVLGPLAETLREARSRSPGP